MGVTRIRTEETGTCLTDTWILLEIEKENITEASEQGPRPRLGKEKTD